MVFLKIRVICKYQKYQNNDFLMTLLWRNLSFYQKAPSPSPLPKICHTHPTMMKLGSYTLPKKEPKNIWITWYTPCVVLTSAFFHQKSANFAISKNTDFYCILAHNFWFFKLFLSLQGDFFNKHGYNFDDVSKIGFSNAS